MTRTFTAHSPLGEVLQFRALSGEERISGLFEFRVTLLSKQTAIPANSLLGQDLSIEMDVGTPFTGPTPVIFPARSPSLPRAGEAALPEPLAPDGASIRDLVGKLQVQLSADGTPGIIPAKDAITANLSDEVNALIALSPSLQADLEILQKESWKITYGPKDGGSFADRSSRPPRIVIDSYYQKHAGVSTQILAHEVGHATYEYEPDYSSRDNYIKGGLADEGMATLNNIRVQREILAVGGRDIGIANGIGYEDFYNETYDNLQSGSTDIKIARAAIGEAYRYKTTSNTGQTYENYYGCWYDKNIARKENPLCPD